MATRRSGSNLWIIFSVAVTVAFGLFGFVWSIVEGQIGDNKRDYDNKIAELRNDFIKYQTEARWNFATKDFVTGKIDGIKEEEATYRKYVK